MKLLIVDDIPTDLKLLRVQLEAEGHAVFEAHDGVDALALLERQRVDAVISDLLMPRMDGYRLCHEIRKHARLHDLPIILYTATYTSPGDEKLALDVGANKFLKKPVSIDTLVAALHEVITMPHAAPRPEALQEIEVLKEYSERLVNKLEEKNTELMAAEGKFRALVEQSIVGIYIVQDDQFVYVNPAMQKLFGWSEEEMTSRTVSDFIVPEDHALARENIRKRISGGVPSLRYYLRMLHQSGAVLQGEVHGSRTEYNGRPAVMGMLLDITERKRAQAALIASELRYATIFEGTAESILIAEVATKRFRWVNSAACALLGYTRDELLELTVNDIHPAQDLPTVLEQFQALADGRITEARSVPCRRKDGTTLLVDIKGSSAVVDGVTCSIGFFTDVTELRRLEGQDRKLAQVVEQTSDSVIIADLAGTIEYVNPAFERVSGYRRDEVIGQNPRILKSGRHSAAFYRALWRRLTRGKTWTGTLINRRKDGSLYEEDATISPIRGPGGETTGYVALQRDVTALRTAESGLAREFRERAEVAAALARLRPGPSAEATAAEICDELLGLPGIDAAMIVNFLDPDVAVPLGVSGPVGLPMAAGRPLPAARATYLRERAGQGPWAEPWRARPMDGSYGQMMAEVGILATAYAPIRNGDGLLGVVAIATRDEAYVRHLIDHLPAVGEFAGAARGLLSGQLERGHRDELVREHVRRALAEGGLRPVFQPIVALASGEPVGYEALTRFADGTPPDVMIAEAHSVGLGLELEIACLAAALDAAEALPQDAWLSLNVSPEVILYPSELPGLLADRSRRFVIEVTEHAKIDDYAAVRAAVAALGPTVSLAVDDAGAGFASLRHIVELAPQFLKLDISLVRHMDRDLIRQAMIAGLSQFAGRAGCEVIAEGIEDSAELQMLRELGVPLGQGYLLGRPEPVSRPTDEA